jgi:hypothetical protein
MKIHTDARNINEITLIQGTVPNSCTLDRIFYLLKMVKGKDKVPLWGRFQHCSLIGLLYS